MANAPSEIRSIARSYTVKCIKVLVGIAMQKRAPPAARVNAAIALLDRGWASRRKRAQARRHMTA